MRSIISYCVGVPLALIGLATVGLLTAVKTGVVSPEHTMNIVAGVNDALGWIGGAWTALTAVVGSIPVVQRARQMIATLNALAATMPAPKK